MRLLLDLTRTLARAGRTAPTGIDRVELAWARRLTADPAARFTHWHRHRLVEIERSRAAALIEASHRAWRGDADAPAEAARLAQGVRRRAWFASETRTLETARGSIWLTLSHARLEHAADLARVRQAGVAIVALVHDLIPIEFPEYARPLEAERHLQRIASLARHASGLLSNSAATANALDRALDAIPGRPAALTPHRAAPLGLDPLPRGRADPMARPYLLMVGTIEARKNHAMLLAVLRGLAQREPGRTPHLVLVGTRGWEAEAAIDLLERSPLVHAHVTEAGSVPEARLADLYAGARALLLPSFAEGYGLPLAEALAAGCPAIASDLPALREVGGSVPEFLDPLDGPAWAQAMLEYAQPESARRAAQLVRLRGWHPPNWEAHFSAGFALLQEVMGE